MTESGRAEARRYDTLRYRVREILGYITPSLVPIFSITLFGLHIAPTWYGLMYALGFMGGYLILRARKILSEKELESLLMYVFF